MDSKSDSDKTAPILWCLASAALFGASTPASKAVLDGIGPITLAGLLYIGSAIAVLPFAFRGGSRNIALRPKNILRMCGAVVFGGALGPIFLLIGLRQAPAASVSLWLNLETVATALLAYAIFREYITKRTWLAVVFIVAGGITLASPSGWGNMRAVILVALACICWGFDNNLTSIIDGFTPAQTTFIKGIFAGLINLGIGLSIEKSAIGWNYVAGAVVIGMFSYGLSIVLYISGAQKLGATRSQMIFAAAPFLGVTISWAILREPILASQIIAALIMATGLWVLLSERHEHVHLHDRIEHTHSHSHDDGHHMHVHQKLPSGVQHTHAHEHDEVEHAHPHEPDLHHRHEHI